jgi:raffinose/stachyose/melibiose transport system permease protein
MNNPFGKGRLSWTPFLFLLPGMFFYFLISLGPSLATAYFSFTDATGIRGTPVNWIGLENYEEFLVLGTAARDNLEVILNTFKFSFFVTTIQFAFGLLLAMLLNQRIRGANLFRVLFFLPVILGVTIQGLMWRLFLFPLGGPVQQVLGLFGVQSELLGGIGAFNWVIVVQIWANVGITMVIFLAGLQTIPGELVEAAEIDGASRWQIFRNVTWPLLTPSVNTNLILNIIGSLQAWQLLLVMIGYRPGALVLGYVVYAEGFGATNRGGAQAFRQGYAAAASIVLFILVLIIGLTTQYLLQRRERRLLG